MRDGTKSALFQLGRKMCGGTLGFNYYYLFRRRFLNRNFVDTELLQLHWVVKHVRRLIKGMSDVKASFQIIWNSIKNVFAITVVVE